MTLAEGERAGLLPLDAAGDRPMFFADPAVDQLMAMVVELSAEVWVVRERLYRVERAARAQGLDLPALAERLELGARDAAELAGLREAFTRTLFRTLNRRTPAARAAADPR